jgi:CBS domain-containing protein
MTTARDIMQTDLQIINGGATVAAAAKQLAESGVGVLPVCSVDGRLQGLVTDRDIVVKVIAAGKDPKSTIVRDVADQPEIVTIGADDSIEEAALTMQDHKVRRLPVIDGHTVVGMVSQGDLAAKLPAEKVGDLVRSISTAT